MEPRIKQHVEWSIMTMVLSCTFMTYLLTYLCIYLVLILFVLLPSVLWHCWLGVRKSIRPVKIEVLAWFPVWSDEQMISIWSNWCHFHPVISCFITQVVLEKRPLNECLSFCRSVDRSGYIVLCCVISSLVAIINDLKINSTIWDLSKSHIQEM